MGEYGQRYIQMLISEATKLLEQQRYKDVFCDWLIEHNHGHSGWVSEVNRIYKNPQKEAERLFADKLRHIVLETAKGLLKTTKPSNNILEYLTVESIALCLHRLGDKTPIDLINQTKELVLKCQKLGAPEKAGFTMSAMEILNQLTEKQVEYTYLNWRNTK